MSPDALEASSAGDYAAVRLRRVPGISFDPSAYVDGCESSIPSPMPYDGEWLRETIIFALPEQGEHIDFDAILDELAVPAGRPPWASPLL